MWDLPGPGLEPVSPALAGGFLTTEPPGKSSPSFNRDALYQAEEVFSHSQIAESFYQKQMLVCQMLFCLSSTEIIYIVFLFYTDQFSNVKTIIQYWQKPHLALLLYPFTYCWIQLSKILRIFTSMFMKDIGLYFPNNIWVWFRYKNKAVLKKVNWREFPPQFSEIDCEKLVLSVTYLCGRNHHSSIWSWGFICGKFNFINRQRAIQVI